MAANFPTFQCDTFQPTMLHYLATSPHNIAFAFLRCGWIAKGTTERHCARRPFSPRSMVDGAHWVTEAEKKAIGPLKKKTHVEIGSGALLHFPFSPQSACK